MLEVLNSTASKSSERENQSQLNVAHHPSQITFEFQQILVGGRRAWALLDRDRSVTIHELGAFPRIYR